MRKWLVIAIASYLLLPTIVAPLFAQRRQGDELGRVATCLCCLDITTPEIHPGVAVGILVTLIVIFLFGAWMSDLEERVKKRREQAEIEKQQEEHKKKKEEEAKRKAEEEERQRLEKEETTRLYGWWVGKKVLFSFDWTPNHKIEGVVVSQNKNILKINYLNNNGDLSNVLKNYEQVKEVK